METQTQTTKKPAKQKRHTFDNGTTWLFYWMAAAWIGTEAINEGGWFNWLMVALIVILGIDMAIKVYQEKQKEQAKSNFTIS